MDGQLLSEGRKLGAADGHRAEREATAPLPHDVSAADLAELERRDRLSGWLLLFFAGATIATAALAFYYVSDDLEPADSYIRADAAEDSPAEHAPFIWGQKQPEAVEERGEVDTRQGTKAGAPLTSAAPSSTPASGSDQIFDFPGPPTSAPAATFAGPPEGSVDRETARALRTGRTQQWREQGQRGYVLVSGLATYGERQCRTVSYTRFEPSRQAVSPGKQWCRSGTNGKWREDARGPD